MIWQDPVPKVDHELIGDKDIAVLKRTNPRLRFVCFATGLDRLGVVATNDCHYLRREDAQAHEILLCIQTGKTLKDADRMKFSTNEFFFRSAEEMAGLFSYSPEAMRNTIEVAERCNLDLKLSELQFPQFQVPPGETLDSFLEKTSQKGLEDRLAELKSFGQQLPMGIEFYRQRLQKEIGMIQKMGFSGYFLIVSDFIRYAKSKGIPVGPGRGSGAGRWRLTVWTLLRSIQWPTGSSSSDS